MQYKKGIQNKMGSLETIRCIFFSEFHPTAGPKIVYQVPEDYISKENFDMIQVYIITKPQLEMNIISLNALDHKFLGCPVIIEGKQYARNALIFNLCLVFGANADTSSYEVIVRKLAEYFRQLEVERHYLFNDETKEKLPTILTQIRDQLNEKGQCSVYIDEAITVSLKVIKNKPQPAKVNDYDVPVRIKKLPRGLIESDLLTQQLWKYIDGFDHIAKIAAKADVEVDIVKSYVENLVYFGILTVIPAFLYSNVYAVTPDIQKLYKDTTLQQECLSYCARPGCDPDLRSVLRFLCDMNLYTTVKDLCLRHNVQVDGFDERKLIQFALINGLVRRVFKYPVKLVHEAGSLGLRYLYKVCDDKHHTDSICCMLGFSYQELDDLIETDPSIVSTWR